MVSKNLIKIGDIKMPIGQVKYNRTESDRFPTLPDGTYEAILEEAEEGICKGFEGEDFLAIKFRYHLIGKDNDARVFRDCRVSLNEKSNLYKDLKSLVGAKKLQEVIDSDEDVTELINSLIGKKFLVNTELTTSKAGNEYNKFISVSSLPAGKAQEQTSYDDDDIPF